VAGGTATMPYLSFRPGSGARFNWLERVPLDGPLVFDRCGDDTRKPKAMKRAIKGAIP
jgi:hypothetical protein